MRNYLATDASSYGVEVVSHVMPNDTEKAIQYASQTLTDTQRKYSQIDKEEAYAIVFGGKKFFQYLYANKFTLITDHRPLTQTFSPEKSLPIHSAMRMQHYVIFYKDLRAKLNTGKRIYTELRIVCHGCLLNTVEKRN